MRNRELGRVITAMRRLSNIAADDAAVRRLVQGGLIDPDVGDTAVRQLNSRLEEARDEIARFTNSQMMLLPPVSTGIRDFGAYVEVDGPRRNGR